MRGFSFAAVAALGIAFEGPGCRRETQEQDTHVSERAIARANPISADAGDEVDPAPFLEAIGRDIEREIGVFSQSHAYRVRLVGRYDGRWLVRTYGDAGEFESRLLSVSRNRDVRSQPPHQYRAETFSLPRLSPSFGLVTTYLVTAQADGGIVIVDQFGPL